MMGRMKLDKIIRRLCGFMVLIRAPMFCIDAFSSARILHIGSLRSSGQPIGSNSARNAKGFAGKSSGGFGSKPPAKVKQPSKQAVLKKLQQSYGGTSAQEIAIATQRRIDQALQTLPQHIYIAVELYKQLKQWDSQLSRLSILQQANLDDQEVQGAECARSELAKLMQEHSLTQEDIHNILQKATWDASADAKAARSLTGEMPTAIVQRVDRACCILAKAITTKDGRCLDVGCGYGVLVKHLVMAGIQRSQIHGVDLSDQMVRNAQELHPGIDFRAADFIDQYDDEKGFDGIIFCSALHDFPDPIAAIRKAAGLLKSNGTLVIVHPQGGLHVTNQVAANPVLVRRGLPDAGELESFGSLGLELVLAPAEPGSIRDGDEGYLAVMQKRA